MKEGKSVKIFWSFGLIFVYLKWINGIYFFKEDESTGQFYQNVISSETSS